MPGFQNMNLFRRGCRCGGTVYVWAFALVSFFVPPHSWSDGSRISYHIRYQVSDIRYLVSDIRYQVSDIRRIDTVMFRVSCHHRLSSVVISFWSLGPPHDSYEPPRAATRLSHLAIHRTVSPRFASLRLASYCFIYTGKEQ